MFSYLQQQSIFSEAKCPLSLAKQSKKDTKTRNATLLILTSFSRAVCWCALNTKSPREDVADDRSLNGTQLRTSEQTSALSSVIRLKRNLTRRTDAVVFDKNERV